MIRAPRLLATAIVWLTRAARFVATVACWLRAGSSLQVALLMGRVSSWQPKRLPTRGQRHLP